MCAAVKIARLVMHYVYSWHVVTDAEATRGRVCRTPVSCGSQPSVSWGTCDCAKCCVVPPQLEDVVLPKLAVCDLTNNKISKVSALTSFVSGSPLIVSLEVLGNPVCAKSTKWAVRVDLRPFPTPCTRHRLPIVYTTQLRAPHCVHTRCPLTRKGGVG